MNDFMDRLSFQINQLRHTFSERASPRQSRVIIGQLEGMLNMYLDDIAANMKEFTNRIKQLNNQVIVDFDAIYGNGRYPEALYALYQVYPNRQSPLYIMGYEYDAYNQNPFLTDACVDTWMDALTFEKLQLDEQTARWLRNTIHHLENEIRQGGIKNPNQKLDSIYNFLYRAIDDKPYLKSIIDMNGSHSRAPPRGRSRYRGSPSPREESMSPYSPPRTRWGQFKEYAESFYPKSRRQYTSPVSPKQSLKFKKWSETHTEEVLELLWSKCKDYRAKEGRDAWRYWKQISPAWYNEMDRFHNWYDRHFRGHPPKYKRASPPKYKPASPPKYKPVTPPKYKPVTPPKKSCYSILNIPPNAPLKDIRKAFMRASQKHHPDKGGKKEKFQEINEAYQILSDPELKHFYDQYMASLDCKESSIIEKQTGY